MPQLTEIISNKKVKKFKKKPYRPWDLSGDGREQPGFQPIKQIQDINEYKNTQADHQPTIRTLIKEKDPELDNKLDIHLDTNRYQLDNNQVSNRYQIRQQLDNNQVSNRYQLDNKFASDYLPNIIQKLSGVQNKVFFFIVDICLTQGKFETGPIETTLLQKVANTSYGSIKITLNRLIKKGLLRRLRGKTARGGYVNFGIDENIKEAILEIKKGGNVLVSLNQHADHKNELDNKLDINPGIYSSSNITTTTKNELISNCVSNALPEEWENINIEPLKEIGFSKNQLKQLVGKNNPDITQDSIYHFSFGLEHKPEKYKKYSDPLNVLMGVLRKGQAWFEKDYESPQDKSMRELLERKKAAQEKRNNMLEELIELEFEEWSQKLTPQEKEEIIPDSIRLGRLSAAKQASLKKHFLESVWPDIEAKLVLK